MFSHYPPSFVEIFIVLTFFPADILYLDLQRP